MVEPAAASSDKVQGRLRRWVPLAAFVALALAIGGAGYLVYHRLTSEIKRERQAELAAVAALKSRQIASWVAQLRKNAEHAMRAPVFTVMLDRWLAAGRPEDEYKRMLDARLEDFHRIWGVRAVLLLDAQAGLLGNAGLRPEVTPFERGLVLGALAGGALAMSDLHWEGAEGESAIAFDLVAPLAVDGPEGKRRIGALLFKIDAAEQLFPLVEAWPAPSASAESFLVRVEGDEMVYLNELRHRRNTALRLRAPLETWELAGAAIIRRSGGSVEGVDYRGVPVLAAGEAVPGTAWHLVSKIDREEVYAPVRRLGQLLGVVVALFVAGAGVAVWLWWRGEQARFAATRARLELERGVLAERLDVLTRHANDIVILMDEDTRIVDANERALEAYGCSREELLGRSSRELRTPEAAADYERDVAQVDAHGGHVYETVHRRKDGTAFPVEISGRFIEVGGRRLRQSIIRDISVRKRAEARIQRLNRLYAALSQTNEAIVRIKDRDELFRAVCRIAVEMGGLRMAWVGLIDEAGGEVVPAAAAGASEHWFARIRPFRLRGSRRAPVEIALGEDRAYFCNDVLSELALAPIREALREEGFLAAASLPLRHGGRVVGALTLFAGEKDYFDETLTNLVAEMAADLSFALENFTKQAHLRKLSLAVEHSRAGVLITDAQGVIEYVNPALTEASGYAADELIGRTPSIFKSGNTPRDLYERLWATIRSGATWRGELQNRTKRGELIWEEEVISPVRDERGAITHFVAVREDVTESREAERRLWKLNRRLLLLSQCNDALLHASDERALLKRICEIIVDTGGYRMAWVGVAVDDEAKTVRPVASVGIEEGYLESLALTWSEADPRGGPCHAAICGLRVAVVNDIAADPDFAYWREAGLARGLRSAAAIPLGGHTGLRGALCVYSTEPGAFSDEEIALLAELAGNLTYGLAALQAAAGQRELNRSLRMLSLCNEALVRATDESGLLTSLCETIVKEGGYRMAWVGFAEHDEAKTVRLAAHAGADREFIESLRVTWADDEHGRGALGSAIRTGMPVAVNDILKDPRTVPWRERARAFGFGSVIGLPLRRAGEAFGVLGVYASTTGAFPETEAALLAELADDLAYGIVALRTAAEQAALHESANVGITFVRDRTILRCNPAFARLLGYEPAQLIGQPTRVVFASDEEHESFGREGYTRLREGGVHSADVKHRRADGTTLWVNVTMSAVEPRDLAKGAVVVVQDIDRRKRAERALRLTNSAVESSANGIMITDFGAPDNPITYVNPAFERITGYPAAEAVGRNARFLLGEDTGQIGVAEVRAAIRERRECATVLRNYRKDGSLFWNELAVSPVRDADGNVSHFVGVINDITERKRYEEELERQASYDALTGLANRNLARDRVGQAIAYAARSNRAVALLFLDLDRFKRINDSLGHAFGDDLLRAVAERVRRCVRENDTVARLGGDEFVIVLSDMARPEDAAMVARKILLAVAQPLALAGREVSVSASIGVSLYPKDGADYDTLLRNADVAMYQAKETGRDRYRFYTEDMNARALERLDLEAALRRALDRGELLLHYQPLLALAGEAVSDVEALVRWRAGDRGLVSPGEFIPLAEETGLIVPIGKWVLREACRQAKAWADAGFSGLRVAVNLSARQFRERGLAQVVRGALEEAALPPALLKLEITESTVMHNAEEAAAILAELKALGVGIAVDDFGTGYSSLAYLRRFPLDQLKIDRSFVRDAVREAEAAAIVQGILGLAKNLRLETVAEGVETVEQLEFLKAAGCDKIQGYLFSPALPAEQLAALLRRHRGERVL